MPAFLETDVLLDQPGTVGERQQEEEEGQVIKSGADRQREELKAREEERKREGRAR